MKNSKLKGILAALLSAALIAGTGCSGTAHTANEQSTTAAAQASAAEVSETETQTETEAQTETETQTETEADTEAVTEAESEAQTETPQSENSADDGVIDAAALIPADLVIEPALWKVTDPESQNSLYLMGTFHAVPESTYPLPDYIEDIYKDCDGIAVEYDVEKLTDPEQLDMAAAQEYSSAIVYTDGTLLSDHVSEDSYTQIKEFADVVLGGWNDLYDYYNIGFWISTINSVKVMGISGFDFNNGVDKYFLGKAKADGKSVTDIEELSAQLNVINAYTDALGDTLLLETFKEMDNNRSFAEEIVNMYIAWASGDIDAIDEINRKSMDDESIPAELAPDIEKYFDTVYYSRNAGMAEKASEYLKNGDNLFFMVGAAHFCGEKGIPALLTDMGYTVEKLH